MDAATTFCNAMENEKLENASAPQEARKCGVWRVMSWGIGCLGAMALLPALASLVLVMAMATWLSYHTPERLSMPPHWEEGLELLTNGGTGVQTIASERFNTAQMGFDGEAFIIRLNSDEDCKRFVEQILASQMHTAYLAAGEDVSFGDKGKGNKELLFQMEKL